MAMNLPKSRLRRGLLLAGVLSTAGLWIAVWMMVFDDPFDDADFDRGTWLRSAGNMDQDNPRGHMAEALIDDFKERRPTRDSVIALLGPSEYPCSVLSPPLGPSETCVSYVLGMWSGLRWDHDTLDVYFGDDQRVTEALTVQH